MSGIAGIIRFDGGPIEPGLIEKMTGAMTHRGPDGVRHWVRGPVALGHCMLRTTQESLEETQPLTNEDESLVLVMDGWVSNWEELRSELVSRGARLRTRSDAELVLRAYETWGRACLEHIDGDFALVIWDARRREAFCARDRLGERPFHYWQQAGSYIFASDFHALLTQPGSPRDVNEGMVAEHLAIRIENLRETLIKNICRLPPASFQIASTGKLQEQRYWDIDCKAPTLRLRDERAYVDGFLDLFGSAIKRHRRSLSPVGFYLSGGVDSSTVFGMAAAENMGNQSKLDTFSLIFPDRECDEQPFIDAVNAQCGGSANCIPGGAQPFDHHTRQIARYQDICDGPNGAMLNPIRSAAQALGIKVMLTGYGGDEWFGKNSFYYAHLIRTGNLPALARQARHDLQNGSTVPALMRMLAYRGLAPLLSNNVRAFVRRIRSTSRLPSVPDLVRPELATRVDLQDRLSVPGRCSHATDPAHAIRHSLLHWGWNLRGREINNREIASFGLEERSPLNDRRMIEYAFALPETMRSRGDGKFVLRRALEGKLPDCVLRRRGKAEFGSILADTLAAPEAADILSCKHIDARGWVDKNAARAQYNVFLQRYRSGDQSYKAYVWPLWMAVALEMWMGETASGLHSGHG